TTSAPRRQGCSDPPPADHVVAHCPARNRSRRPASHRQIGRSLAQRSGDLLDGRVPHLLDEWVAAVRTASWAATFGQNVTAPMEAARRTACNPAATPIVWAT